MIQVADNIRHSVVNKEKVEAVNRKKKGKRERIKKIGENIDGTQNSRCFPTLKSAADSCWAPVRPVRCRWCYRAPSPPTNRRPGGAGLP